MRFINPLDTKASVDVQKSFFQVEQRLCRDGSSEQISSKSPPAEIAARWRCGPQIKIRHHITTVSFISASIFFDQEPLRRL